MHYYEYLKLEFSRILFRSYIPHTHTHTRIYCFFRLNFFRNRVGTRWIIVVFKFKIINLRTALVTGCPHTRLRGVQFFIRRTDGRHTSADTRVTDRIFPPSLSPPMPLSAPRKRYLARANVHTFVSRFIFFSPVFSPRTRPRIKIGPAGTAGANLFFFRRFHRSTKNTLEPSAHVAVRIKTAGLTASGPGTRPCVWTRSNPITPVENGTAAKAATTDVTRYVQRRRFRRNRGSVRVKKRPPLQNRNRVDSYGLRFLNLPRAVGLKFLFDSQHIRVFMRVKNMRFTTPGNL